MTAKTETKFDWGLFWQKLAFTLASRKFWALLLALVTIWGAYYLAPSPEMLVKSVELSVGALAGYAATIAIEDGLKARK